MILGAGHAGAQEADVYGGEEPAETCESGVGSDAAQDPECQEVLDDNVVKASAASPEVLDSSTGGAALALTGVETMTIAIVGMSTILVGAGLVLYKRRHEA